jgi:hypothetical protein
MHFEVASHASEQPATPHWTLQSPSRVQLQTLPAPQLHVGPVHVAVVGAGAGLLPQPASAPPARSSAKNMGAVEE